MNENEINEHLQKWFDEMMQHSPSFRKRFSKIQPVDITDFDDACIVEEDDFTNYIERQMKSD